MRECDRWDLGKVLVYSTSMDVNSCFSASKLADLHNGIGTLNTETPIHSFAISAGKAHPLPSLAQPDLHLGRGRERVW